MPEPAWSSILETGHELVDQQHRELFAMVRELQEGLRTGHPRHAMGELLARLATYTGEHFATEEAFMAEAGYPHLFRHKAKHDNLRGQVRDLLREWHQGVALPGNLTQFLSSWITHHIHGEDFEMIEWLEQHKKQ